jgi:hypothetical protein
MRGLIAGLLACAWLGFSPGAFGQFRPTPPSTGYQPSSQTQMISNPVAAPAQSFNSNVNPSWFPPWYPPIYSPAGAYLSGASDVINSQGNFLINKRQSQVINEQAKQAQLDTQRKAYEQWQWEQSQQPTLQDVRQQSFSQALARARGNPPQPDIWSGWALNTLLQAIQQNQATTGLSGPMVPLDPSVAQHINFTTGTTNTTSGSIGMFKNGKLEWPDALLAGDTFSKDRGDIDKLVSDAFGQLKSGGRANANTIDSLRRSVDRLRSNLRAEVAEMGSNDYVRSLRFVNELRDGIGQLSAPNAVNYVNGTWQAQGATIGELIQQMTGKGLRFAPATPGNESFYSALYQGFISYDAGLSRLARR